jgi:hypothetical protein
MEERVSRRGENYVTQDRLHTLLSDLRSRQKRV